MLLDFFYLQFVLAHENITIYFSLFMGTQGQNMTRENTNIDLRLDLGILLSHIEANYAKG